MRANGGSADRMFRIIVGLGLIGATVSGKIGLWGWIGVAPCLRGREIRSRKVSRAEPSTIRH